jgi:hypothetical protein
MRNFLPAPALPLETNIARNRVVEVLLSLFSPGARQLF